MFLPTPAKEQFEIQVWKLQIAKVFCKQIAMSIDETLTIPTLPPNVELISHLAPEIHMLKLMDASDNSAKGICQVFQSMIQQTGLTSKGFFGRFQLLGGDLATIQNFHCLRNQCAPSAFPEYRMDNIYFQLGASHTLWDISSTLFTHHFGNPSNMLDCGAWQHLEALGFSLHKAIQKKDFTLMVNQMERVFEALICYCLMVKRDIHLAKLGSEKVQLPTETWHSIIEECYVDYCTPKARWAAAADKDTKLSNTLMLFHDFSTVVEAKRLMKAGDVGRLMLIWKKWSIMCQSLNGLNHYATYLSRTVLLLDRILPVSMRRYLRHNLLISPSGRPGHFVAKDFWLEIQNYWLKFFFNKSGQGTQVEKLKNFAMFIL
ncbi:hypothetical protein PCASD_14567 [Puccinia coronata f. sp. avenae]|uniref:DUF6589 domain-containing protein n=1 Tax=Puccinia coronata f. sp. avenae TaxID=200324 RepID=A0A2N5TBK0_9BASI|nr:hypothetical protein PCASD_14567 [Puccinia coronata f. sp. avenae]